MKTLFSAIVLLTLISAPALAKKPEHAGGHKGGKHHAEERHHDDDHGHGDDRRTPVAVVIGPDNRIVLQDYLRDHYRDHCPPGLAKKRNGCLPPGQAKKRYRIGHALPAYYQPLPPELIVRLGPPPPGAFYAMVDTDVLLVAEAGKKILDAVTLLSAVR